MAKNYTNLFEIIKDSDAYLKLRNRTPLDLSHFRQIAQNRWPWFVQNWTTLRDRFKAAANGNLEELSALADLDREIKSYKLGNTISNPFESLNKLILFNPFLTQISLSELNLTVEERTYRDQEILRILELDIEQFRQMIDFIKKYAAIQAQKIGLGDKDAAKLAGIKVTKKQRDATIDDLDKINNVLGIQQMLEGIVFDLQSRQKRPPNLLAIANNNIDPASPVKLEDAYTAYVPVPFSISLEAMAEKYLGSKSKWYELATINNLKPPFVDEVGTKLPLLAPAAINNVIISSLKRDSVFVGSKVGIGSYKYREETRIVEKIIINDNNTMILFLSGAQDINRFHPRESAYVRIFEPNTIRQGEFVNIPLKVQVGASSHRPTPTDGILRQLEQAFIDFGIDIARDVKTNDILIDSNGNFRYAMGFSAVKQAIIYALRTERGELPFHPAYGISTNIGQRYYGTTTEAAVFGQTIISTIKKDQRFEQVLINNIATTGTSISIQLLVTIRGSSTEIPLFLSG